MLERIKKATDRIRSVTRLQPETAIILGSGLHRLAEELETEVILPYRDIPGFPEPGIKGHKGALLFGTLAGREVVVMDGRYHYYEGHDMESIALPVRVMRMLGATRLVISNAAGGMRPGFGVGDLMLIEDHINMMGTNPLIGKNLDELGPRFPDMSTVYDPEMREMAISVAKELGITLHGGIYAAVTGPVYETPAEYRYLYRIGADAVGMSTVPEAIVARHMDMKIMAISVITDLGIEGHTETITHEAVLTAAEAAAPRLTAIVRGVLAGL
jgi:purine-nucleoside phosphorylase